MPIPTTVADLSTTASANYPAGSESPNQLDDYHRALASIVRQVSDAKADASHTQAASTISDSTAAGRALLTAADAAAQRTALGLGTAATAASSSFATSGAVTGNGNTMATAKMLGRSTAGTGAIEEITVGSGLSLSGGVLSSRGASALVNFDGTGTIGVNCTIRSSVNVSSVYKSGTGDYLITFSSALADANYVVIGMTGNDGTSAPNISIDNASTPTTTTVRIATANNSGTRANSARVCIAVFGL